jgi:hypothetical protein
MLLDDAHLSDLTTELTGAAQRRPVERLVVLPLREENAMFHPSSRPVMAALRADMATGESRTYKWQAARCPKCRLINHTLDAKTGLRVCNHCGTALPSDEKTT